MREGHRHSVTGNRVPRKIFGLQGKKLYAAGENCTM